MLTRLLPIAAACLMLAVCAAPAAADSGLVGEWKLDEGSGTQVADSTTNGNDGELSGAAGWVPGVSGSALSFDGTTGQVDVPEDSSLERSAAVTVTAWVKATGSPGTHRYILAKGANRCIAGSYGLYSGPTGGLEFYVSEKRGTTYAQSPDAGLGVWDGNWHLAVGTFDGSTIRLYVDGTQIGSGTSYPGPLEYQLPDSNDLYIGNYPGCPARAFRGAIDDVKVFDRALPASQLTTPQPGQSGGGQTTPNPGTSGGSGAGAPAPGGGSAPGTTSTGNGVPGVPGVPGVHSLALSSSSLVIGPGGRLVGGKRRTGVTISYTATEAARLTITVLRSQSGVRRGGRCLAPGLQKRGARQVPCTRFVVIGSLIRTDPAGRTTARFDGLLAQHRLAPGLYRLDLTPRAGGKTGPTASVRFTVRRTHS